jgi:chromosome partitioning protein
MIISCLSQKGGVGKSTIARAVAVAFAKGGWTVQIADMDNRQSTCFKWAKRRREAGIEPNIEVTIQDLASSAIRQSELVDLLIIDGRPAADSQTLEIALASDLVIMPTSDTYDDLEPTLELANELAMKKVPKSKIMIPVTQSTSEKETRDTISSIKDWGFDTAPTSIMRKTAYSTAMSEGKTIEETSFESMNHKSELIIQYIADRIAALNTEANQ